MCKYFSKPPCFFSKPPCFSPTPLVSPPRFSPTPRTFLHPPHPRPLSSRTHPDPSPCHEEPVVMTTAPRHPSPCILLVCTVSSCLDQILCPPVPFLFSARHPHQHAISIDRKSTYTWEGVVCFSKSWFESTVSMRMVTLGTSYPSSCTFLRASSSASPSFPCSPERAGRPRLRRT